MPSMRRRHPNLVQHARKKAGHKRPKFGAFYILISRLGRFLFLARPRPLRYFQPLAIERAGVVSPPSQLDAMRACSVGALLVFFPCGFRVGGFANMAARVFIPSAFGRRRRSYVAGPASFWDPWQRSGRFCAKAPSLKAQVAKSASPCFRRVWGSGLGAYPAAGPRQE